MYLLQIQNIDSLKKAIIDSLLSSNLKNPQYFDYINKIDSFYNNSWTKLAILFGLIGVIVPITINYFQVKKLSEEKKEIKADILNQLRNETNKYLNKRLRIIQHASEGVSYSIQARMYLKDDDYENSFHDYVTALTCFYIGKDFPNFQNTKKEMLEKLFPILTKDMYKKFDNTYSDYFDLDKLINRIEKSGDNTYCNETHDLKKAIEKLK